LKWYDQEKKQVNKITFLVHSVSLCELWLKNKCVYDEYERFVPICAHLFMNFFKKFGYVHETIDRNRRREKKRTHMNHFFFFRFFDFSS